MWILESDSGSCEKIASCNLLEDYRRLVARRRRTVLNSRNKNTGVIRDFCNKPQSGQATGSQTDRSAYVTLPRSHIIGLLYNGSVQSVVVCQKTVSVAADVMAKCVNDTKSVIPCQINHNVNFFPP